MSVDAETVGLFRRELALCEVGPCQTVAVLSEGEQLLDYAEASLRAASQLGAMVHHVHVPAFDAPGMNQRLSKIGQTTLSRHTEAIEICKSADMVVDHMLLLFSAEQAAIQQAGTRVLLVVEPVEILERLFPTTEMRMRVEAAERRLSAARTLRFVNDAGTDATYHFADPPPVLTEYGYTATPGRWDHWSGGFVAAIGQKGGVEGRVVMDAGDIIYPLRVFVDEPLEFVIRGGKVTEINGGAQAAMLRDMMASHDDPRAYAVSHIGWGLHRACAWDPALPGVGMDGRGHWGNVLFSLGPDTEFGGDNDTPCHFDLPMKACSLWLDDEPILDRGEVLPPDQR